MNVEGTIDLFFSDSDMPIREQEVRRYLPQISPFGLILMHDASSHLKQVREAALNLEREGLISVVLLPTPRGLVVAQKREGEVNAQRHPARNRKDTTEMRICLIGDYDARSWRIRQHVESDFFSDLLNGKRIDRIEM